MVTTTTQPSRLHHQEQLPHSVRGRMGWIVAGSMAAGLAAAALLVVAPFIPVSEHALTGMVLLRFALGWALLVVLSIRFSDQPQRWPAAPAAFMAAVGVVLLGGSAAVRGVLGWVWPPALFVLVVWMFPRPDGRCAAGAHDGCCTPSSPSSGSPLSAAARP